jgi:hypothetical protein
MTPSAHDRRQRRILIGVALMFFAPLALSFYLYYGKYWHPGGRVNAGELIDPARPLPALALPLAAPAATATATGSGTTAQTAPQFLKGKWTFLYVRADAATMNAAGIFMTRAKCAWRSIAT